MDNEYAILEYLHRDALTTQRKIAARTGLSLGTVNLLIKKMVHKGLIKVERLNARTMCYILTPRGLKEKTRLTYNYVRRSYRQIVGITGALTELIQARMPVNRVILYGPHDEVAQILTTCLRDLGITYTLAGPEKQPSIPPPDQLVLFWRHEEEEKLPGHPRVVNILKLL